MYCPIMLDLENKKIVVIGAGKIAYKKIKTLLKYKPKIKLISKELDPRFKDIIEKIEWIDTNWNSTMFENAYLTIAATNDEKINTEIERLCNENHQIFNRIDRGINSNFRMMSKFERGDLTIAISTNGTSPSLARHIKKDLEKLYPKEFEDYIEELGKWRILMKNEQFSIKEKQMKFEELILLDRQTLRERRTIYENNCRHKRK